MKVFHHNDLDGRCSAYLVYENEGKNNNAEFFEINYNKKFPFEKIVPGERIVIVDFSINPDEMRQLLSITKDIVWIDHHKTAIEKYSDFGFEIKGLRDSGYCGAMLTHKYYHGDSPAPQYVVLTNDHDLWKFEYGDITRAFQIFMDCFYYKDWISGFWRAEHPDRLQEIINSGSLLLSYKKAQDKISAKANSFVVNFEGLRFLAINQGGNSSILEAEFNPDNHDAFMLFSMGKDKQFKVSLFTEKEIDLSQIALKYGGGGHKKACGFYIKNINEILL